MRGEKGRGERRIDVRTDVYSLAAVLYAMLAGEPPFTGPTVRAVVARVLSDPLRPIRTLRPALPVSVERALARGLAKIPAGRPATVPEFVDALTAPIPKPSPVAARPVIWIAIGGVVLAVGIWWRVRPAGVAGPPGIALLP